MENNNNNNSIGKTLQDELKREMRETLKVVKGYIDENDKSLKQEIEDIKNLLNNSDNNGDNGGNSSSNSDSTALNAIKDRLDRVVQALTIDFSAVANEVFYDDVIVKN